MGRLWPKVKVAFALIEPGQDWGAMTGDSRLVQLGVLSILGEVLLGVCNSPSSWPYWRRGVSPRPEGFFLEESPRGVCWGVSQLASLMAECGEEKRQRGLMGEGASEACRGRWDSEVDSYRWR
ncbi:hypothetical protein L3X38_000319 [Prunus dulcis]|uniref:Uncharacterized protein n=1 Tax=Prunus dulcis TaxID=3755 RepID=A0AAD4USZ2_PRUDU|nr:hypothetical protein L3X38_000319 [Prunus dulcis]